jgi:hypothetical protein
MEVKYLMEKSINNLPDNFDYTPDTPSEQLRVLMTAALNEFVKCGVIGIAFDKCGLPRRLHRVWKEIYPEYLEMFNTMNERFVDGLESVAIERAKEKSDSLMILLLKANRPDKYNIAQDVNFATKNDVKFIFAEGMLSEQEKQQLAKFPVNSVQITEGGEDAEE